MPSELRLLPEVFLASASWGFSGSRSLSQVIACEGASWHLPGF